jgi:hypothetical protein
VIELLAITDDPAPVPPPLRIVPAAGLGVVVSAAAEDEEVDADALWRREALIEELMQQRALLPVRFGTRVEDDTAAAAAVAGRAEAFAGALRRVRGAVELSVRVVIRDENGESGPAEHMQARAAGERAAAAMHQRLAAAAREDVRQVGTETLRAAYLVDRADVDGFVALVRELQAEHPELSAICTGPWPPYSFSEGEDA